MELLPVVVVNADGTFFYHSTVIGSEEGNLFKSLDHGVSWQQVGYDCYCDDPRLAIDTSSGMGRNYLYCSTSLGRFIRRFEPTGEMTIVEALRGTHKGTVAVAPDGTVFYAGLDYTGSPACGENMFAVNRSTNIQDVSIEPVIDLSVCVNLGGQLSTTGRVCVACDASQNTSHDIVYLLASVNPPGPDLYNVMFARSFDKGQTWSSPIRINEIETNRQWLGAMSVAPTGRVDVVWYDTRNFTDFNTNELYYSHSTDHGASWSLNKPLSLPFNAIVGQPEGDIYIGNDIEVVSDETHVMVTYPATFNNEQDLYFLRFPAFDCNQNGTSDSVDISVRSSEDCDGNGTPDECQPFIDCNANSRLDSCDLIEGISADCDSNDIPDECQPFVDCNENNLADYCELASQRSNDCNANSIPDECENRVDCNLNLIPDECDIASGHSADCDSNGTPDECSSESDFDGDGAIDACDTDIDNDGVLNGSDFCDYSPLGAPVQGNGAVIGDVLGDCDVDLADYSPFDNCLVIGGPNLPLPAGCTNKYDADSDDDIDFADFAHFQRVFTSN